VYVGGEELVQLADVKGAPVLSAYGLPLTQLALGFKSVAWRDDELFVHTLDHSLAAKHGC
jgi:hypothetical protein